MSKPDSLYAQQVARTYHLALSKALRETLEYLDSEDDEGEEAYGILNTLLGDESDKSALTTEFIEERLELYRQKRKEVFEQMKSSAIEELTVAKDPVKDEL